MLKGNASDEETEENVNPGMKADLEEDDDLYYYSEEEPPPPPSKTTAVAKVPAAPLTPSSSIPKVVSKPAAAGLPPSVMDKPQLGSMGKEPSPERMASPVNSPGRASTSPSIPILPGSKAPTKYPPVAPLPKAPVPGSPSTFPQPPTGPQEKKGVPSAKQPPFPKGSGPNALKGAFAKQKNGLLDSHLNRFRNLISPSPFLQKIYFHIFFIYLMFGLLFSVLSCPLSQLDQAGGGCYTYWGFKSHCDTVSYTYRPATLPCTEYSIKLQIGAAFSLLNILCMAYLGLIGYKKLSDVRRIHSLAHKRMLRMCSKMGSEKTPSSDSGEVVVSPPVLELGNLRYIMLSLVGACFVFQVICSALIASLYAERPCQDTSVLRTTAYGNGFGLLLITLVMTFPALCITGMYAMRFS